MAKVAAGVGREEASWKALGPGMKRATKAGRIFSSGGGAAGARSVTAGAGAKSGVRSWAGERDRHQAVEGKFSRPANGEGGTEG